MGSGSQIMKYVWGWGWSVELTPLAVRKWKVVMGKYSYTSFQMLRIGRKLSRFVFNINGKSTIKMESGS